ncbi:MAG: GNAT family N-acetyltransferase [Calditrichaeota bacterium]|jgi:predicted acetyltransferase|nr:GNAT family N-acetyltransferase [Calditrichota bacterium]MBT7788612.1 GNAT family N-acetyltransferase [Calditrichota bacterium]
MPMQNLKLIKPTEYFANAAYEMMLEISSYENGFQGFTKETTSEDFPAYIDQLIEMEQGHNLPDHLVPMTTFWLIRNESELIGIGRLRHRLNDRLREHGGHIGCMIRPHLRSKGLGTALVSMLCDEAAKLEIDRVLLTCLTTNIASKKIIEKNGGKLEREGVEEGGRAICLYWIDLGEEDLGIIP